MNSHKERILRVCGYISHNLDDDISLERLSEVALCSKYHFHRIFKSFMGVSAIRFIQLARMKRACFRLAFEKNKSITDIAYEARFNSPEAFSRAFARLFGQTPSQFRKKPDWRVWHSLSHGKPPAVGEEAMNVRVVDFKERKIAFVEHRGNPERVLNSASKFIAWRKETGLSPVKSSETFGVPYSDPKETPEEDFRFDICGTVEGDVPGNEYGVRSGTIPGGRCAVVRHKGSHENLSESVYRLYRQWLPDSGEELRDYPCFFHYLNFVHEVEESELLTDIYLPLK